MAIDYRRASFSFQQFGYDRQKNTGKEQAQHFAFLVYTHLKKNTIALFVSFVSFATIVCFFVLSIVDSLVLIFYQV